MGIKSLSVNLNNKYVTVGLIPYSAYLTFHDQSYSLARGFNNPINFCNS